MKDRNIDVATIGLVFASMPIIFQLGRMFFATLSDFWGRRLFFILNALLGVISNLTYYLAHSPLEFLFGKATEGTKMGSLWAVNRPFLLEKSNRKWQALVRLRTASKLSLAIGSLLAGFLIIWLFYEGTLMFCVLIGGCAIPLPLLLVVEKKKKLNTSEVLHHLDVRKKRKIFRKFFVLFFVMGASLGFLGSFVFPLFLSGNGFDPPTIGLLLGLQVLLSGLFMYLFEGIFELRKLILLSGLLYTVVVTSLGFSSWLLAGILIVVFGIVDGLLSVCQEGILTRITNRESYGTDIGLLTMGLNSGRTLSLAMSGLLIGMFGFAPSFLLSALIFVFFFIASYVVLKEQS